MTKRRNYTRLDSGWRDMRVFFSSLVIGLCLGALGVYVWAAQPRQMQVQELQTRLATIENASRLCADDVVAANDRVASCQAEVAQLQTQARTATPDLPLPKPPPERTAPVPPQPAAPAALPPETAPAQPEPPSPPPAAQPNPPAPVPTPAPSTEWPSSWPPKPRPAPSRPAGQETAAPPAAASLPPVSDGASTTLKVGEEKDIGNGLKLLLVAVSKRSTGQFCIVAGEGMTSARIPSGGNVTVTRSGQRIKLSARVQGTDSCRIEARPG
jgi:outer membrane biosynthesis protein TonB